MGRYRSKTEEEEMLTYLIRSIILSLGCSVISNGK